MQDGKISGVEHFDLQGHRGCRGVMPENTIPAFLKALEIGVNTLEMDAVITSDFQVILSHEPFFSHEITTKPDGTYVTEAEERSLNIFQMTFSQTQQFDVGLKPHPRFSLQQKMPVHKPLLAEMFDSVIQYCQSNKVSLPFFNIETKSNPATDNIFHPEPGKFVDLMMQVIMDKQVAEQTIIQSFDFRTLQYLHQHYPFIKTAALVEDDDNIHLEGQLEKLGFTPAIYSPAWELVTPGLVKACREKGIKLVPWTVNDQTEMLRLKKMGVDGLITDFPDQYK